MTQFGLLLAPHDFIRDFEKAVTFALLILNFPHGFHFQGGSLSEVWNNFGCGMR